MARPVALTRVEEGLRYLLGNPLLSPVIAELYDNVTVSKPNFALGPKSEFVVVEEPQEAGIVRAAFLSTESPRVRYRVMYEVRPGRRVEWDYSAEELLFLGLDEHTGVGPYVTKAEQAVNPWTGETVWVYSIYFPPLTQLAFYNGSIRASISNPDPNPVRVWLLHVERLVLREDVLARLERLLGP